MLDLQIMLSATCCLWNKVCWSAKENNKWKRSYKTKQKILFGTVLGERLFDGVACELVIIKRFDDRGEPKYPWFAWRHSVQICHTATYLNSILPWLALVEWFIAAIPCLTIFWTKEYTLHQNRVNWMTHRHNSPIATDTTKFLWFRLCVNVYVNFKGRQCVKQDNCGFPLSSNKFLIYFI